MQGKDLLTGIFTILAIASLALACGTDAGGDGNGDGVDAAQTDTPDSGQQQPTVDAGIPVGFDELIARSWTIPAGATDVYYCTRVTVQEDVYIQAFSALSPLGTHHTVLSVDPSPSAPDGDYNCDAGDISHSMVFASGVGTDDITMPEGVAIKVSAGQQLDLNLHLYNFTDSELTGTSGTLAKTIPVEEVVHEAEVVFGGSYIIFLPNSPGELQTVRGGCRFDQDATVVALWPHMHQLGRHMTVVHESGSGNATLLDEQFHFDTQVNYAVDSVQVSAGERLAVDCVYMNDTGGAVFFGDGSNNEMCFVGIYRYPATGAGTFDCVGS